MLDIRKPYSLERERALAEGIQKVVAELRLVDVVDYIAFLRLEQLGNIADLVTSSSELYLKPGVLRFANSGEVMLTWASVPVISLALEFKHDDITTHFRLELSASSAAVDITYIAFDKPDPDPNVNTRRLREAIHDAHLRGPHDRRD